LSSGTYSALPKNGSVHFHARFTVQCRMSKCQCQMPKKTHR
jgi:hypothetical protein